MAELNWTDAQWQKVNDCVTEAFGKASVASAFLPCYGPLAGSAETVRNERLKEDRSSKPTTIKLDGDHDSANLQLVNLTVKVELSTEQVADETLSNAMLVFRRAASILALAEDRIVFEGYKRGGKHDPKFVVNDQINAQKGLADTKALANFQPFDPTTVVAAGPAVAGVNATGVAVVSEVVKAIARLEDDLNPGPFACVLGNNLFEAVQQPSFAFVLPSDRITPLLKGPLLRSGQMDDDTGIVLSLPANEIDIVVGTPPTVQFLQRTPDAKFLFRVYERFVLRIRDEANPPVAGFRISSAGKEVAEARILEGLAQRAASVPDAKLRVATAKRKLAEAKQRKRGGK
jgi:uncharacterized linocin/CFP29 family protein